VRASKLRRCVWCVRDIHATYAPTVARFAGTPAILRENDRKTAVDRANVALP
jgi:hypothetical protein